MRAKLRQIDSLAEERLEKIISGKTIVELFNWMRDMNDFREKDFDHHIQLLAQELAQAEGNQVPDLAKAELMHRAEDAEHQATVAIAFSFCRGGNLEPKAARGGGACEAKPPEAA